jgi:hypothetical protein
VLLCCEALGAYAFGGKIYDPDRPQEHHALGPSANDAGTHELLSLLGDCSCKRLYVLRARLSMSSCISELSGFSR